jgi:hypothetical protein
MALELSESLEKITLPLFARPGLSGRFFRGIRGRGRDLGRKAFIKDASAELEELG